MKKKESKGRLIFKEIQFDQVYHRTVRKSNDRSGKVHLPADLIGKHVFVIIDPENK